MVIQFKNELENSIFTFSSVIDYFNRRITENYRNLSKKESFFE